VTIPEYQTVVLPLLNLAADGEEHKLRDAIEELADHFNLTEDERKELLPSGSQATFDNLVGWARTYMKKACFWNPRDAATSGSLTSAYGPWSGSPR
jgi:restriction system protein